MQRFWMGMVAAVAVCGLVGCGEAKKVTECKALIGAINPHSQQVRKLSDGLGGDVSLDAGTKILTSMANEVEAGANDVKKLTIETPELKKFADDYTKMCGDSSKAFKDMITATGQVAQATKQAEANDPAAADTAAKASTAAAAAEAAMKKAMVPEDAIIDGINKFCGAE